MKILCFGLGYVALRLAQTFSAQNIEVIGTSRNASNKNTTSISIFDFDKDTPLSQKVFEGVSHILCSIPPVEGQDLVIKHHQKDFLKLSSLQWIGYLSTTGVYGDHQGQWVDEDTPPHPLNERSTIRLAIENQWHDLYSTHSRPVHIFRLAGIYGPGRNVFLDIEQGKAQRIIKKDQVFSRIHVEDLVQALVLSMRHPHPGRVYNLADDLPSSSSDVIAYAARLLKVPMSSEILFEDAMLSEFAKSFYLENRRVSNKRMKEELGVKLLYPTYRDGLKALLKEAAPKE
jgi:nucleoside-diphosphate-sugar epimerase